MKPLETTDSTNLVIVGKNSYIGNYFSKYIESKRSNTILLSSKDCDFLDLDEVRNFFKSLNKSTITILFFSVINKTIDNSFQSFMQNIKMVQNLIKGTQSINIQSIIYFSAADVYGSNSILPITEQTTVKPESWYSLAKCVCEWMLLKETKCPVTILRMPGIYGCSENDKSIINKMIVHIRKNQSVIVKGDGSNLRDFVYIDDLSRLLQLLIDKKYNGILNIATGKSDSILNVVKSIKNVLQEDFEIIFEKADEERNFNLTFDTQLLASLLPYFRFNELEFGIKSYLKK